MKYNFKNEDLLINGLKNGEEDAYAYLVNRYHYQLCVYANSLIHNDLAAEDIVQNVLVAVWKKRHRLKEDFSVKNFLYKSVHNEFIDQYRKNKSVLALEKKYIDALESICEEKDEHYLEKMMELVERAIEELPPKCKRVFILSKKEGLTNFEISEHLNISKKTIEGQITRAYVILREKLGDRHNTILFLLVGFNLENKTQ